VAFHGVLRAAHVPLKTVKRASEVCRKGVEGFAGVEVPAALGDFPLRSKSPAGPADAGPGAGASRRTLRQAVILFLAPLVHTG